jgi:hypothetical protein
VAAEWPRGTWVSVTWVTSRGQGLCADQLAMALFKAPFVLHAQDPADPPQNLLVAFVLFCFAVLGLNSRVFSLPTNHSTTESQSFCVLKQGLPNFA